MRDDLDLAVFLHFPKVSREMSSLQGMLLGSSGGDALGMGCSGGTSGLWEQSVGSWNPVPPSHLHVCMVQAWQLDAGLPPNLWNGNVGRYKEGCFQSLWALLGFMGPWLLEWEWLPRGNACTFPSRSGLGGLRRERWLGRAGQEQGWFSFCAWLMFWLRFWH